VTGRKKLMHYEDAIKFLIERLRTQPDGFLKNQNETEFDVYIPRVVQLFLFEQTEDRNFFNNLDNCRLEKHWPTWVAFYDAGAELCRRGIFRLGRRLAKGFGRQAYELEECYTITAAGREWLANSTARYIPVAPSRYLDALRNPGKLLGEGFLQRAGEAAGCHAHENHLACCAMCGAAAESALLAIADEKTGDPERVQRDYRRSNGRQNVTKLIFGSSPTTRLTNEFQSAFDLLTYWRDEAAHGGVSTITPVQSYDALDRLVRLAFFTWDNWEPLTGKKRPA
jgi:hypothetical protein